MLCETTPCGREAVADVQWGSDALPAQTASFCQEHVDDLWKRLNPLVQANRAWFRIDQPGRIER